MKTTVSLSDFRTAFASLGRENFSYTGLEALYNWLEELDDDCGTETELDVITLCCDFVEYENLVKFQQAYSSEEYETFDDIANQTILIMIDEDRFIIQAF